MCSFPKILLEKLSITFCSGARKAKQLTADLYKGKKHFSLSLSWKQVDIEKGCYCIDII